MCTRTWINALAVRGGVCAYACECACACAGWWQRIACACGGVVAARVTDSGLRPGRIGGCAGGGLVAAPVADW